MTTLQTGSGAARTAFLTDNSTYSCEGRAGTAIEAEGMSLAKCTNTFKITASSTTKTLHVLIPCGGAKDCRFPIYHEFGTRVPNQKTSTQAILSIDGGATSSIQRTHDIRTHTGVGTPASIRALRAHIVQIQSTPDIDHVQEA